ncbi:MAG: DsbA family protein, partial [Parcubacteria group bacterium]|nr:DsbA family protein [Parcubacteria group bacterium]
METIQSDEHVHRARSWVATIVTVILLALLSVFVWRVLHYVNLIKSGELSSGSYNFTESFTTSIDLASQPVRDGTIDVVTSDDPSLGNPSAPVKIVEFADFQCPYSKEASSTLRELALKYPNEVYYVYRDFPLTEIHPLSQKAAEAGECADDQGKFWEYHDKLYQNQSRLDDDSFVQFAMQLNMNVKRFEGCLSSGQH